MRGKAVERTQAITLRREGHSIRDIATRLRVSVGSVSVWVRDVVLSDAQLAALAYVPRSHAGAEAMRSKALGQRAMWQQTGRKLYATQGKQYAFGCALYWGEGDKSRNCVGLSNTDVDMLVFWITFLRKFFDVQDAEFLVHITCYLTNGLSLDDVQRYWLDALKLPATTLGKTVVKGKYYAGEDAGKWPYGVCHLRLGRTDIVQAIYGSIKEAIGDASDRWLDIRKGCSYGSTVARSGQPAPEVS